MLYWKLTLYLVRDHIYLMSILRLSLSFIFAKCVNLYLKIDLTPKLYPLGHTSYILWVKKYFWLTKLNVCVMSTMVMQTWPRNLGICSDVPLMMTVSLTKEEGTLTKLLSEVPEFKFILVTVFYNDWLVQPGIQWWKGIWEVFLTVLPDYSLKACIFRGPAGHRIAVFYAPSLT